MQNDAATIPNYVGLTSDVVSAYVSNNSVSRTDLPGLIGTVHAALSGTSSPAQPDEKLTPPVPINKTIRQDYIISLEDGRRYKAQLYHGGHTPERGRLPAWDGRNGRRMIVGWNQVFQEHREA